MHRVSRLVLIYCLLTAATAGAQEGPLKVALSGNYLPLHGSGPDGMFGLEADLARALGEKLGREVEFVNTRKAFKLGTIDAVAQGKVDLGLNSITPTPERARKVDFTKPYLTLSHRLAGKDPEIGGDLAEMAVKVAAPSAIAHAAVAPVMPKATILDCKGMRRCIQMVLDDEAKFLVYEDVGLFNAVADVPLAVYPPSFGASPLAIATPKGKVAPIDRALIELKPILTELIAKWKPDQNYMPQAEKALLARLPRTLIGLVQHEGRLVQPSYCYAQSPATHFENKQGSWEVWQALGQDSATGRIQRARRVGRGKYRIKVSMAATVPTCRWS